MYISFSLFLYKDSANSFRDYDFRLIYSAD